MESKYANLLILDKARPMLEACAYKKQAEIDDICAAKPEDTENLFRFVAALSMVYQSDVVLKSVMEMAERKMANSELGEFASSVLKGAIKENRPDCFTIVHDFMNERKMKIPALEEDLAECFGGKGKEQMAGVIVSAGANVTEAMRLHEKSVLAEIRRHSQEILSLREHMGTIRSIYGVRAKAMKMAR